MKFKNRKMIYKYIWLILAMILFVSCTGDSYNFNGSYVVIEDQYFDPEWKNYGLVTIKDDSLNLYVYNLQKNFQPDTRTFFKSGHKSFEDIENGREINLSVINDSLIEINFSENSNRFSKIKEDKESVNYDFTGKKFRYSIEGKTYTIFFENNEEAIGTNIDNLNTVKYKWKKVKNGTQWFLILNNELYPFYLLLEDKVGDDIILSRYLENKNRIIFQIYND